MSEILIESMTRFTFRLSPGKFYNIRMWRQEKAYSDSSSVEVYDIARKLLENQKHWFKDKTSKSEVAQALLQVDRMNAVEVLDEMGDGVVMYKDWP
jgi:hypothetical protein